MSYSEPARKKSKAAQSLNAHLTANGRNGSYPPEEEGRRALKGSGQGADFKWNSAGAMPVSNVRGRNQPCAQWKEVGIEKAT